MSGTRGAVMCVVLQHEQGYVVMCPESGRVRVRRSRGPLDVLVAQLVVDGIVAKGSWLFLPWRRIVFVDGTGHA